MSEDIPPIRTTDLKPEELPENVVDMSDHREPEENPWRLVGAKFGERKMLVQTDDGQEVRNGFILLLQFLDREPGKVITRDGDKTRNVTVPIPLGMPNQKLYELLVVMPWMIQQHLDGVPQDQMTGRPPWSFMAEILPEMPDMGAA